MKKTFSFRSALVVGVCASLAACGGGGGDSPASPLICPSPKVPNAAGTACVNPPTPTCTPPQVLQNSQCVTPTTSRYSHVGSYPQEDCVQDNTTGLMWEGKKPAGSGHLRAADQRFTNYHTSYYGTQAQMDAATNTYGYVKAVNASNLCGFNDWRLPTKEELRGIVDTSKGNPAVDTAWLVNTESRFYWSSSRYVGDANYAWGVYFRDGNLYNSSRGNNGAVRLVRAQ